MYRSTCFLLTITLFLSPTYAQEQEDPYLGIYYSVCWQSLLMWNGIDYFDGHAAFLPFIDFDLYQSGFHVSALGAYAGSIGFVNTQGHAYQIKYTDAFLEDSKIKTDCSIAWKYIDFMDNPSEDMDLQELIFSFSWPELFEVPLTPTYYTAYMYTAQGGGLRAAKEPEGFTHTFGLVYNWDTKKLPYPVDIVWNITYRDGWGGNVYDEDWTHSTFSITTPFDFADGALTQGLHYQISMDDSVNPEDELWTTITYSYSF